MSPGRWIVMEELCKSLEIAGDSLTLAAGASHHVRRCPVRLRGRGIALELSTCGKRASRHDQSALLP